ncbi:Ectopic P granules protein 5 [Kappamyces sp. JEL0829]|nr:Ectopic P granules protein 5 [Kappamyces sp. JEL0829]
MEAPAETLERSEEQLESWEDLHQQISDLEAMYPSAPSGPVFEFQDPEVHYPIAPLLTMNIEQLHIQTATADLSMIYPSAPMVANQFGAMELHGIPNAPADAAGHDQWDWKPMSSGVLEDIYSNPLEPEYKQSVDEFRTTANSPSNDAFFKALQEYELSFFAVDLLRERMAGAVASIKLLTSKYWTVKREPETVRDFCPDGWGISHTFIKEVPQCNSDLDGKLNGAFADLKRDLYIESPKAAYRCKVRCPVHLPQTSKLWITNHINELLLGDFGSAVLLAQKSNTPGIDTAKFSAVLESLAGLMDTLFFYERKESTKEDSMALYRADLRTWILRIATCLYWSGNSYLNRRTLLQVLRTNGVSSWGTSLIEFPIPKEFSESYVDNYLVSLKALLGPIEELEELLGPKRQEEGIARETIKRIEGEQWVVVEDDLFGNPATKIPFSIYLQEGDYLALLGQFNVLAVFRELMGHYFGLVSLPQYSSVANGNTIMKGVSIAHQMFLILSRTLTIVPVSYRTLREMIASLLVSCCQSFPFHQLSSSKSLPLHFSLPDNSIKQTTMQLELDSYSYRIAQVLLSKPATGLGVFVLHLPVQELSHAASIRFIHDILDGSIFRDVPGKDKSIDYLVHALLRNEDEGYIFNLLVKLLELGGKIGQVMGIQIIECCFQICLSHSDLQQQLFVHVKKTLYSLCRTSPAFIGNILQRSGAHFKTMEAILPELFQFLPLDSWHPLPPDVLILENLLKDPVGSAKSNLARSIIDRIDWEHSQVRTCCITQDKISIDCQKILALALVNIHLDLLGRAATTGLVHSASTLVTHSLGAVDKNLEFEKWSWKILKQLSVYATPSSTNSYSLSSGLQPFESWDSVSLATLKGFATTDAMAAYAVLILSEIGHRFDLFDGSGWEILEVVLASGQIDAFLSASYNIFRTISQPNNPNIFASVRYRSLVSAFWKSKTLADQMPAVLRYLAKTLEEAGARHVDVVFAVKFWCNLVFAVDDWTSSRMHLELLDCLASCCFTLPEIDEVLAQLNHRYRSMIFSYSAPRQDTHYVPAKVFQMIGVRASDRFPSLIQEKSSIMGARETAAKGLYYFLCLAITVEVFAERDIRNKVAASLARNVALSELGTEASEKPVSQFSIYRLAELVLEFPADHPTTPVLWQTFTTLYFERYRSQDSFNNSCFGYRFFEEKKDVLLGLERKLSAICSSNAIPEQWAGLVNAISLWMHDPRLLLSSHSIHSFPPDYYPDFLAGVVSASLLEQGSREWWKSIIVAAKHTSRPTPPETAPAIEFAPQKHLVFPEQAEHLAAIAIVDPVLKSLTTTSFGENLALFRTEMERLKQKGIRHSVFIQQHNDLDETYLQLLKRLYGTSSVLSTVTKRCGTQCLGVVFQFEQERSVLHQDVNSSLASNRTQAQALMHLDLVDQDTALSGLQLKQLLQYIVGFAGSGTEDSKKKAKELFYAALDLWELNLQSYPPADIVLTLILKDIGSLLISGNVAETLKIFPLLQSKKCIPVLAEYFVPACLPERFAHMYRDLAGSLSGSDMQIVISRFRIAEWLGTGAVSAKQLEEFVEMLTDCLSSPGLEDESFAIHSAAFKEIVSMRKEQLLVFSLDRILRQLWVGAISTSIISDWLRIFIDYPLQDGIPASWSFVIMVPLDYAIVVQLLSCVQTTFSGMFAENPVKFIHLIKTNLSTFMLLLNALLCCNVLYTTISHARFQETWNVVYLITLSVLQIEHGDTRPHRINEMYSNEDYRALLAMFVNSSGKIAKLHGKADQVPSLLWKLYVRIVPAQSYTMIEAFHTEFALSDAVFERVSHWIAAKTLSVASIHFIGSLFLQCTIDLSPRESGRNVVSVILHILSNITDFEAERKSLFVACCGIVLGDQRFSGISVSDWSELLQSIPDRWFDQLDSIEFDEQRLTALPCLIHFLLRTFALSSEDQVQKQSLLTIYIGELLSKQSQPEIILDPLIVQSKSFADEQLGAIALQYLKLVESEWNGQSLIRALRTVVSVANQASKNGKPYSRLVAGLSDAIKATSHAISFLDELCHSATAPEQLARFCELCIERHTAIVRHKSCWTEAARHLAIPELDESIFIRSCLSHSLSYTLYTLSVARLDAASSRNAKVTMGEQIGVWIESIQLENSASPVKSIHLVLQFLRLLALELEELAEGGQSRIVAHLPAIQDTFFRWSTTSSLTLWSALGLSKPSALPVELRLFCKFLANFIASRLLGSEKESELSRLQEAFESFLASSEYAHFSKVLLEMKRVFLAKDVGFVHLYHSASTISSMLFPDEFQLAA